jgi:hypothetical protein
MAWYLPIALIGYVGYRCLALKKKPDIPVIQIKVPGVQNTTLKAGQVFLVNLPDGATWNNPPVVGNSPTVHVVSQGLSKPLIGTYDGKGGSLTLGWMAPSSNPGNVSSNIGRTVVVFR